MTRRLTAALALSSLPWIAVPIQAQPGPKRQFAVVNYIRVQPDKLAEYRQFIQSTGPKLAKAFMDSGRPMLRWSVAEVYHGGARNSSPDFMTATVYDGPPPEPGPISDSDAIAKKAIGMTMTEFAAKLSSLGTVIGNEILADVAVIAPASGDWRTVSYVKSARGKAADNVAAYRDVTRPLMAESIKEGNATGWSAWQLVFPRGTGQPYDLLTTTTFKDRASALTAPGPGGAAAARFAKVHPGRNYVSYVDSVRNDREVVKTILTRVIASASR
jgi:hypothetical protein